MGLENTPGQAIGELGKFAERLGRQPPEARLLTFGLATMVAFIPLAIFTSIAISFGLLGFGLLMSVLYLVVLRANREPPRVFKREYDAIYREYSSRGPGQP